MTLTRPEAILPPLGPACFTRGLVRRPRGRLEPAFAVLESDRFAGLLVASEVANVSASTARHACAAEEEASIVRTGPTTAP